MNQTTTNITQEQWLKVLGKGMVTLPKKWRDEMRIQNGDILKAKKEGNKVIIESAQSPKTPYRVYTKTEIDKFLKEDILPKKFAQKVRQNLSNLSRT